MLVSTEQATSSAGQLRTEEILIETASGEKIPMLMEIAEKPVDLQVGLMYREKMDKDHGMMFLMGREPIVTSFWMKNTLIPLDMLFVAQDGRIAHIHRNATPHSLSGISSREPVTAVVEINGGRADALGISIGDKVIHPYFGNL